jgi:hypothetical protein
LLWTGACGLHEPEIAKVFLIGLVTNQKLDITCCRIRSKPILDEVVDGFGVCRSIFWHVCDPCAYTALPTCMFADAGTLKVVPRYASNTFENIMKRPLPTVSQ